METKTTAKYTLAILQELTEIEAEDDRKKHMIDDLKANNDSQKTTITIMRYRHEADESIIDRTMLCMIASVAVNFLTIGWIVYSAF